MTDMIIYAAVLVFVITGLIYLKNKLTGKDKK